MATFFRQPAHPRYAKEVWAGVKDTLQLLTDDSGSTKEWRCILKMARRKNLKAEITKAMVAATVNYLWMERNNRRFKNQFQSARIVLQAIICYVKKLLATHELVTSDWYLARVIQESLGVVVQLKCQSRTECRWEKPPDSFWKLNTDSSYKGGKGGYGGIIRNDLGIAIMEFSGGGNMNSIEELEMYAILQGCRVAIEAGCKKLIVHSDSLRVIQAILGREGTPWYCENMAASIKKISLEFFAIKFEHCYRECNRVADHLAKHMSVSRFFLVFILPLDSLAHELIESDKRADVNLRIN